MMKAKAAMLQEKASELLQREEQQKQACEGKKRKCLSVPRRLFPPHVVTHLESLFDTEKYIKENQIEEISLATNLNEKQIRSWFKQRRFRYNLENREKGKFAKDFSIDFRLATDIYIDFFNLKGLNQDYVKQRNNIPKAVAIELEKAFQKNNYVYGNDKKALSRQLNLKPIQLERWFYYRRKKRFASSAANANTNSDSNLVIDSDSNPEESLEVN